MSARNTLAAKAERRQERSARKAAAARRVPFHGVVVTKGEVLGHRYLAVHGLPYSSRVASVHIESVTGTGESNERH